MIISSDDENNNITSNQLEAKEIDFDKSFESSIRPKTFKDYIGQTELKETLSISIQSAKKKRAKYRPHAILWSPRLR